jgi:hypothetical protein
LRGARRSFRRSFSFGGVRAGLVFTFLALCLLPTVGRGRTRRMRRGDCAACGVRRTRGRGYRFRFRICRRGAHLRIYQSKAGGGVPLMARICVGVPLYVLGGGRFNWFRFGFVSFRFPLFFFFIQSFFLHFTFFFLVWRRRMVRREIACAYRRVSASVDSLGAICWFFGGYETCTHDPRRSGAVLFGWAIFFFVLGKKIERKEGRKWGRDWRQTTACGAVGRAPFCVCSAIRLRAPAIFLRS